MREFKPKPKSEIIRETLAGWLVALIGAGLFFVPMLVLGEMPPAPFLYIGAGLVAFGMYISNKKATGELVMSVLDRLPFLKDRGEG